MLRVDNVTLDYVHFSAGNSGDTRTIYGTTPPTDHNRRVWCEIFVTVEDCCSGSAQDYEDLYAELTPYVTVGSDTGNTWWSGMWRRDIWYQVWHHNSTPWSKGGQVTESFSVLENPCGYEIDQGIDTVNTYGQFPDTYYSRVQNPACAVVADQDHYLSTSGPAGGNSIHQQRWRWDTSGIWRQ